MTAPPDTFKARAHKIAGNALGWESAKETGALEDEIMSLARDFATAALRRSYDEVKVSKGMIDMLVGAFVEETEKT